MREALRRQPAVLIVTLALVPCLVTFLVMAGQLGGQTLLRLVTDPGDLGSGPNPLLALLRPLGLSTLLLALLGWLAVNAPDSALLRHRSMRVKRFAVAAIVLITGLTLWTGIILGDLAWHVALQPLPETGPSLVLMTSPGVYGIAGALTAVPLYWVLRPGKRGR